MLDLNEKVMDFGENLKIAIESKQKTFPNETSNGKALTLKQKRYSLIIFSTLLPFSVVIFRK